MSEKKFSIHLISAAETIDLRSRVLRPGQAIELCRYSEDNLSTSFHVGARDANEKVLCNGTFIQQGHDLFPTATWPYRLRGMASDPFVQKQGLGSAVVLHALQILTEKKCDLLWFNARTSAEIFYQKLGFITIGETFDIPLIGPHKVMYKWL